MSMESPGNNESRNESTAEESGRANGWFWRPVLILAIAVFASFGRSLTNDFAYDDFPFLVDNPAVQNFASPWLILTDASTYTSGDLVFTYRPLRTLLFACEHALFGNHPFGYHLVNLAMHWGVAILGWLLARYFLSDRAALSAGFLFACHPLLTEVVASVKAQDDLVASLAILGALVLFCRRVAGSRENRSGWNVALLILYAVGLLAKATAILLPVLLVGTWFALRGRRDVDDPGRFAYRKTIVAMAAIAVAFLVLRAGALDEAQSTATSVAGTVWKFPSALYYVPLYVWKFVWPAQLTVEYADLATISMASVGFWLSVAVQLAVLTLLWSSRVPAWRCAALLFYVTLLPSLNPLGHYIVFAERFAYLPVLGLSIITVAMLDALCRRVAGQRAGRVVGIVAACAAVAFCARSIVRCADWKDSETLFRAALAINPELRVMKSHLVNNLLRQGRQQEAAELLPKIEDVIKRQPASVMERGVFARHALAMLQREDYEKSAAIYAQIVASPYANWRDWLNYGTALTNLEKYELAKIAFETVLRQKPTDAGPYRMLGRIALEQQDFVEAQRRFAEACRMDLQHEIGWYLSVYATWRAEGDGGAIGRIDRARQYGISIGHLFAQEAADWTDAGPELRMVLDREIAGKNQ